MYDAVIYECKQANECLVAFIRSVGLGCRCYTDYGDLPQTVGCAPDCMSTRQALHQEMRRVSGAKSAIDGHFHGVTLAHSQGLSSPVVLPQERLAYRCEGAVAAPEPAAKPKVAGRLSQGVNDVVVR